MCLNLGRTHVAAATEQVSSGNSCIFAFSCSPARNQQSLWLHKELQGTTANMLF